MLQRFKNWIIKKLGGYTKAEYDNYARLPIDRFVVMPEQTRNVVTLRTEMTYDHFASPPSEWIEDRLCGELGRQIKPYVRLERGEDYCNMMTTIRAYVKVVDTDG